MTYYDCVFFLFLLLNNCIERIWQNCLTVMYVKLIIEKLKLVHFRGSELEVTKKTLSANQHQAWATGGTIRYQPFPISQCHSQAVGKENKKSTRSKPSLQIGTMHRLVPYSPRAGRQEEPSLPPLP